MRFKTDGLGFRILRSAALALLCAGAVAATAAPSAFALRPLTLGFSDDARLAGGSASAQLQWIERAVSEGATVVRMDLSWAQVAPPIRPPGFRPADPSSPGYNWSSVDAAVRQLSDHGLRVLFTIADAPTWAEGAHRPSSVQPGTWRPNPGQFALFALAAARRYSGSYPDPQRPGATLPRVSLWQA